MSQSVSSSSSSSSSHSFESSQSSQSLQAAQSAQSVEQRSEMTGSANGAAGSGSDVVDNRLHPAHEEFHGCQYVGDWGDCDPFKMIRVKEERLVLGDGNCVEKKNTTQPCSRDDHPPGTHWLLNEHKL